MKRLHWSILCCTAIVAFAPAWAQAATAFQAAQLSTLTLGSTSGTAGALVELQNTGLVITDVNDSTYTQQQPVGPAVTYTGWTAIYNAVQDGNNGGNWLGTQGITGVNARLDTTSGTANYVIAYNYNGGAGSVYANGPGFATWGGVTLGSTADNGGNGDMLIRETYAGDANLDGVVDVGNDLNIWETYWGTVPSVGAGLPLGPAQGDFNYYALNHPGQAIDVGNDLNGWETNWGNTPLGGGTYPSAVVANGVKAVPEPSTVVLLLVAVLFALIPLRARLARFSTIVLNPVWRVATMKKAASVFSLFVVAVAFAATANAELVYILRPVTGDTNDGRRGSYSITGNGVTTPFSVKILAAPTAGTYKDVDFELYACIISDIPGTTADQEGIEVATVTTTNTPGSTALVLNPRAGNFGTLASATFYDTFNTGGKSQVGSPILNSSGGSSWGPATGLYSSFPTTALQANTGGNYECPNTVTYNAQISLHSGNGDPFPWYAAPAPVDFTTYGNGYTSLNGAVLPPTQILSGLTMAASNGVVAMVKLGDLTFAYSNSITQGSSTTLQAIAYTGTGGNYSSAIWYDGNTNSDAYGDSTDCFTTGLPTGGTKYAVNGSSPLILTGFSQWGGVSSTAVTVQFWIPATYFSVTQPSLREMLNATGSNALPGSLTVTNSGLLPGTFSLMDTSAFSFATTSGSLAANSSQNIAFGWASNGSTGVRSGTVSLTGLATGDAAPPPQSFTVTGAVVTNRVVTSTSASYGFGLIHLGQSFSQSITLSTTGDDSQYTRVSVTGAGPDGNGLSVSGSVTFAGAGSASFNLFGTPNAPGVKTGSIPLPVVTAENNGAGLPGENLYAPIPISYIGQVFSGSGTWNSSSGSLWGAGPNSNWTDANGIQAAPGTFPGFANTDSAIFSGSGSVTTIDLTGANPSLNALSFSNSSYTLSGGSLTLSGSNGTATVMVSSGTQSIKTPMTLASNATIDTAQNAQLSIAGGITEAAPGTALTKTGGGILSIAGNIAYSGSTTVDGGTLQFSAGQLSSPIQFVGNSGIASFVQSGGANTLIGSGLLYLGNASSASGTYNLSGGSLSTSSEYLGNSGTGSFTQSGGTHSVSNAVYLGNNSGGSGTYNLSGSGLLSAPLEYIGNSGTGSFTQSGGTHSVGDLFLAQNAGSTGTYNLNGGLLRVFAISAGSGNAIFNFGGGTLGAVAPWSSSLNMNMSGIGGPGSVDTTGGNISLSGILSGSGGLTNAGPGTLTLSGTNDYNGGTIINAGVVQVGNNSALGAGTASLAVNGGTLDMHGYNVNVGAISGSSVVDSLTGPAILTAGNGDATSTFAGSIQDGNGIVGLTKVGAGAITLSGNNLYTGATIVSGGKLVFASSAAIGGSGANVNANYGATVAAGYAMDQDFLNRLALSSSGVAALAADSGNALSFSGFAALRLGALGTANYSGVLTPSGTTYRLGGGGGVLTVSGPLCGANGLDVATNGTQPGSVILAGATTYTGSTRVSGGTLVVEGGSSSSSFTANGGGTLQFSGATINLASAYIRAMTGGLVQFQNANITGGFLRGPSPQVLAAGSANSFNATTVNNGAVVQQNGTTNFTDVANAGQINNNSNANLTWQGGSNASSGAVTVNNAATVNVSEWYNDGVITVNNGGLLNNSVSNLVSGGGSQIYVNSGGTLNADSNAEGVTLDLQGSLLVNNGTITGTTNVQYGATAKGSGIFGPIDVSDGGMLAMAANASLLATSLAVSSGSIAGAGHSVSPATVADVTIATPDVTDTLTLSGNLSGAGPITKTGAGMLILSGDNSYGGGTTVSAGTLEILSSSALPAGTSLTVSAGATLIFSSAAQGASVAGEVQAVPEPSTFVLLGVGALGFAACAWRRRSSKKGMRARPGRSQSCRDSFS